MKTLMHLPFPVEKVMEALPEGVSAYLVGGAVRDYLLNRNAHDFDFLLAGDVMSTSRRLADALGGVFFALDKERDYARLILTVENRQRYVLDFAPVKDGSLEADLRSRDFTVNAIAVNLGGTRSFIDPLNGAADLLAKRLQPCSPTSLMDDPVRVLRAVRLAVNFQLQISHEVSASLRSAASSLRVVSPERIRDELFRILGNPHPAAAIRLLDTLGILSYVLPDLASLTGVEQPPPHVADVWEHTLDALAKLEMVLSVIERDYDPDRASNLMLGLAVLQVGRFRQQVSAHLETPFTPDRSLRPLLFLGALFHDVAKPATRQLDNQGRIRFYQHEQLGAELARQCGRALRLSGEEIVRLETMVRGHMRPLLLAQAADQPSARAIYRYFRDLGAAGIDICLLSLADTLATYGPALPQKTWVRQLDVVRCLWEAYWEKPLESVSPVSLLDGHDLMQKFGLSPGPKIGQLIAALREAQAVGEVSSIEEAYSFVQKLLDQG